MPEAPRPGVQRGAQRASLVHRHAWGAGEGPRPKPLDPCRLHARLLHDCYSERRFLAKSLGNLRAARRGGESLPPSRN
jgi:hypothetical protein